MLSFRWLPPLEAACDLATVVRESVWGIGPHEPVTDLQPLLDLGRFDLSEADLAVDRGGQEAMMFPGAKGRLYIRVDSRPKQPWGTQNLTLQAQTRRHRLRFRVAHEVAHSFFYDRTGRSQKRSRRSTPAEERFCDLFAGALLIPTQAVAGTCPDAERVIQLHEFFDVSVEMAARRVAEVHAGLGVAVGYWREEDPCLAEAVRLQWASESLGSEPTEAVRLALTNSRTGWSSLTTARCAPPRRQVVAVGLRT